jgi:AraC-like DNA-binding protein
MCGGIGHRVVSHAQAGAGKICKNDTRKSVSEIAYEMGFKYPSHFTRFFKQHVGYSPKDYRIMN